MPTPIWSDPRYAEFFRGADAAIADARRTRAATDLRAARFQELMYELYGSDDAPHDSQAAA